MRTNLSRGKESDGEKGLHSVAARSEIAWHLLLHVNIWETIIESCGPRRCDVPSLFLASVTGYACLVRQEQVSEILQEPNEEPPVKDDNERWGVASHWNKIASWIKRRPVLCCRTHQMTISPRILHVMHIWQAYHTFFSRRVISFLNILLLLLWVNNVGVFLFLFHYRLINIDNWDKGPKVSDFFSI